MKEVALYIHIPFCKKKCLYCDFPSYSGKESLMKDYAKALKKEIIERCSGYIIKSLFIGGGTPSYLDNESLVILLDAIAELNLLKDCEKTMECNPGTVNESKLELIKKYGINRLSFGLQSTNNRVLQSIGRIHTFEEFKENYYLARKLGFENINIDIMFGLPDVNKEDAKKDIERVIKLNPEHISFYGLIIEEGTPFYSMYNKGDLKLPDEEEEREIYNSCRDILEKNGYNQYEISNYSKNNYRCQHNVVYWECREYIGVGVSASSYIDNKRIKNIDSVEKYIKNINQKMDVSITENINCIEDDIEEFMFMGLRMIEGISEEEFKRRFSICIDEIYKDEIKKNIQRGLLIRDKGRIYLTKKGIELSNEVMSDMIITV